MSVGRRGFLGRVAAALGVGPAARASAVGGGAVGGEYTITKPDVAAREVTYSCYVRPLTVVRIDDATMAKIEAGPLGPVANGFGARYFDGAPEPVVPESARAARARLSKALGVGPGGWRLRGSAVAIVPDGGELPVPRG
jgi:hypothetical protein